MSRRSCQVGRQKIILSVFCSVLTFVSAIDQQERIGTCVPISLNVTYYVNANEGVWFPQYRALDDVKHTMGNKYSCHTTYEKVYLDDGQPARLESDTYSTLNGKVLKDSFTSSYSRTSQRGKLAARVKIGDYGEFDIFNYILHITPEYRVRYVCTNFPSTIPGVTAVYIETRKTFPKLRTIEEAMNVLRKHKLDRTMVKIRQKRCTRPINMDGYVSLVSNDKSKEK